MSGLSLRAIGSPSRDHLVAAARPDFMKVAPL
jgi:hypothetical protein